MTLTVSPPRPPRLAAWLVELFASAEQAESILGDLHEEFSDVAPKSGVVSAHRWYWRQSVRTIFHLFGAALRKAPWSLASIVLVGFLILWFSASVPERVSMAILRAQRPYSNLHYDFYLWLINYGVPIACVVRSLLIGCVVTILAKGREVVATIMVIVVRSASAALLLLFVYEINPYREPSFAAVFHFFVFRWVLDIIGILVAGVLVRKLRSVSSRPVTMV